jgi:lipopolysaccharide export system protein LptA
VRFTIERIRTFLLAAGVSIVVAMAVFLGLDKWRHSLAHPDIPRRLGVDIQQEASGVTYTQARGGHTLFKIHAARVVELKNDHATLHDVLIDLYGRTGGSVDRIRGAEFDYDNKTGVATAAGQVQITLEQPASSSSGAKTGARAAGPGQIHVTTRGLVFNQQTGMVTTEERVQFSTSEATGSALGASYDSGRDLLELDHEVEISAHPAPARGHAPASVELHAQRAEFDRAAQICTLTGAIANSRGEEATAAEAKIAVRGDGSVATLDASAGFTLATAAGSHLAAPRAAMEFNRRNQPLHGHLAGGVTLHSSGDERAMSGSATAMDLLFNGQGELRHAHLEGQVEFARQDTAPVAGVAGTAETTRTWHSPEADLDFRSSGPGKLEPVSIRGRGGVVVTSQTRRPNGPPRPVRATGGTAISRGPGACPHGADALGRSASDRDRRPAAGAFCHRGGRQAGPCGSQGRRHAAGRRCAN